MTDPAKEFEICSRPGRQLASSLAIITSSDKVVIILIIFAYDHMLGRLGNCLGCEARANQSAGLHPNHAVHRQ
jgi:hypothetical protein